MLTLADEIDAVSFTIVLTSKLDTDRLFRCPMSKLIPSILLTVSVLMLALVTFNVLYDATFPWVLLTVKHCKFAHPPIIVLTFNNEMSASKATKVLTIS